MTPAELIDLCVFTTIRYRMIAEMAAYLAEARAGGVDTSGIVMEIPNDTVATRADLEQAKYDNAAMRPMVWTVN